MNTRSFKPSTFSHDNKLILHHGGEVFQISDGQRLHALASFANHRMIDVQFSNGNSVIDGITETGEHFRWRTPLTNSEMHPRGQYCVSPDGSQLACLNAVFMSDTRFWITDHSGKRSQLRVPAIDQVNIPNAATTAINDEGRYLALTIAEVGGGDGQRIPLDNGLLAESGQNTDLVELDAALNKLADDRADLEELVSLRFFAGLTMDQAATALGISKRTAERNWTYAKAWLMQAIQSGNR